MMVVLVLLVAIIALIASWLGLLWYHARWRRLRFGDDAVVVGFFHPYCNAGGGGERVLWTAIHALQTSTASARNLRIIVYTGDTDASPEAILARTKDRFNIELPRPIDFVFLTQRRWVEDTRYPHFTLLCQSLGSAILGLEALLRLVPDVYIDSMGYAFTYPIFKLLGRCAVACYVHYPTISSDMLRKVERREASYNNQGTISRSAVLSLGKLTYYRLFARLYGAVGRFADVVMVNSSWTRNHIVDIWQVPSRTVVVFPPCNTETLQQLPFADRRPWITSVAQFRPEKNHRLQLQALAKLFDLDPSLRSSVRLILIGGCRHEDDQLRQRELAALADELNIEKNVEFMLNSSFDQLRQTLSQSMIGLHTMWNEHFGIGVVEYMAAGLVPVAHRSGGPLADIVVPFQGQPVGFLADTAEEYAEALSRVLRMTPQQRLAIQHSAREAAVARFADALFVKGFIDALRRSTSLRVLFHRVA